MHWSRRPAWYKKNKKKTVIIPQNYAWKTCTFSNFHTNFFSQQFLSILVLIIWIDLLHIKMILWSFCQQAHKIMSQWYPNRLINVINKILIIYLSCGMYQACILQNVTKGSETFACCDLGNEDPPFCDFQVTFYKIISIHFPITKCKFTCALVIDIKLLLWWSSRQQKDIY